MNHLREILTELQKIQEPVVLVTHLSAETQTERPLGARWICAASAQLEAKEPLRAEILATLQEGRPRIVILEGRTELLLEPLQPGRLAPWIHFCAQLLERDKACVPAVVIKAEGEIPYLVGETFAYDARSHGLVPLDQELNIALHHATGRALKEGTARIERFPVPGGNVTLLLEPLGGN